MFSNKYYGSKHTKVLLLLMHLRNECKGIPEIILIQFALLVNITLLISTIDNDIHYSTM